MKLQDSTIFITGGRKKSTVDCPTKPAIYIVYAH